jgi:hypothetical protein
MLGGIQAAMDDRVLGATLDHAQGRAETSRRGCANLNQPKRCL